MVDGYAEWLMDEFDRSSWNGGNPTEAGQWTAPPEKEQSMSDVTEFVARMERVPQVWLHQAGIPDLPSEDDLGVIMDWCEEQGMPPWMLGQLDLVRKALR